MNSPSDDISSRVEGAEIFAFPRVRRLASPINRAAVSTDLPNHP